MRRAEAMSFFFKSLKKAVFDATGKEYNPTCLVSDAAGAISRGFEIMYSKLLNPGICSILLLNGQLKIKLLLNLGYLLLCTCW
jgi:hypothetical protein